MAFFARANLGGVFEQEGRAKRMLLSPWLPWLVLIGGLTLTLASAWIDYGLAGERQSVEFQTEVDKLKTRIESRLKAHVQVMLGVQGLFEASDYVSRTDFHEYVTALDLDLRYPGIQGLGYVVIVPRGALSEHIDKVRAQGFSGYHIWPEGTRDLYTSILYLEPFSGRNLAAFGYDMFSERQRRAAMIRARDEGVPAMSGKVRLVQETYTHVQAGIILFVPVYRHGTSPKNVADRRENIVGWAYSPLRMTDLMDRLLISGLSAETRAALDMELYDGDGPNADNILFDNHAGNEDLIVRAKFMADRAIDFGGSRWTLKVRSLPSFEDRFSAAQMMLLAAGGSVVSFLLAGLLWSMIYHQKRIELALQALAQAHENLAVSEDTFRVLFETVPQGVIYVQPGCSVTLANPAALALLGMSFEQLHDRALDLKSWRVIHEDGTPLMPHEFPPVVAYKTEHSVEDVILGYVNGISGDYVWIRVGSIPVFKQGKIASVYSILEDVTESRAASERLRSALGRLSLARDAADIGVWSWNIADDSLEWDGRTCEWYEIDVSDQTSINYSLWLSRVHPDDRPRADVLLRPAHETVAPGEMEYRIVLPSGRVRHMHSSWVYEFDHAGNAVRVVGVNRDVSQQREQERLLREAYDSLALHQHHLEDLVNARTLELAEARDAAESANRAKSAFLMNMSHELRTPMNQIMGFAYMLRSEVSGEKPRIHLAQIDQASHRLLGLINDILNLVRLEASQIQLKMVEFDLISLLDHVENSFRSEANTKGLTLIRDLESGFPAMLRGDPIRLDQVLSGLLSNAVKFSDYGEIVIRVRGVERSQDFWLVRFEVVDQGIGVSDEVKAGLFRLFSQGDDSMTRKYGGTGLGLALCKRLVALMTGDIGVVSEPGKGSTFWFSVRLGVPLQQVAVVNTDAARDWGEVARAVSYLAELLTDGDFEAQTLWRESACLLQFVLRGKANAFGAAVESFEFETALALLQEAVAMTPELYMGDRKDG